MKYVYIRIETRERGERRARELTCILDTRYLYLSRYVAKYRYVAREVKERVSVYLRYM